MTEAEIWEFVGDAPTGIVTTLRRDGVPVALPVWFASLDRVIYMQTRGKKLQRIAHDQRASFLVETGHRWVDLKAVHFTGVAEIIELEPDLLARFGKEMKRKYDALRAQGTDMPPSTSSYYANVHSAAVRSSLRTPASSTGTTPKSLGPDFDITPAVAERNPPASSG